MVNIILLTKVKAPGFSAHHRQILAFLPSGAAS